MDSPSLHIAMFPWFAMGHLTPYLHLSNKLAKRGHRVSFFIPKRTQAKLEQFNLYPHLITFYPINVPHVDGLPHGAETTSDVSFPLVPLIMTAMDRTENDIELLLLHLKPQIVFFDFTYWLPNMTRRLGIKSFQYHIVSPATISYTTTPARMQHSVQELLLGLELTNLPFLAVLKTPIGFETIEAALPEGFKERVEGRGIVHSGWIQQQLILEHPSVGCFITHCGAGSLTEALVNKCQIVLVPQLDSDHIVNARMMGGILRVGVEVEKGEEDGFFTKDSVCKGVRVVMDEENEVGREVRENHAKVRNFLVSHNLESACVDSFCQKLQDLLR
ncbi:UDP-glycosyltransferase 79B30 [Cajanus cajan]|uniref:UDP-glycosyltransferase 79B30 n=1 Tax=Cajanus cajan TaxID=3821 RepID=UPI0010FB795E|nr:UDP-glycosyltransferase 79B30 [Cajanus cajan]